MLAADGGVGRIQRHTGIDIGGLKMDTFCGEHDIGIDEFAPRPRKPRGGIERPRQGTENRMRTIISEIGNPYEPYGYVNNRARMLGNLAPSRK